MRSDIAWATPGQRLAVPGHLWAICDPADTALPSGVQSLTGTMDRLTWPRRSRLALKPSPGCPNATFCNDSNTAVTTLTQQAIALIQEAGDRT